MKKSKAMFSVLLSMALACSLMGYAPAAAFADEASDVAPGQGSATVEQGGNDTSAPAPTEPDPAPAPTPTPNPAPAPKPAPGITFAQAKVEKALGAGAFTNKLTKTKEVKGTLTFTSSNKSVATVGKTGRVTVKGIGTAVIKVKSQAVKGSKAYSASYTLVVNPKGTSISKVFGKVGGFTVSWAKKSSKKIDGYRIRYADNASMKGAKGVTIGKTTTIEKIVSGLKDGQTYYVQVRTYVKVKGKTYYSTWSKAKAVKAGINSGDAELDAIITNVVTKKIGSKGANTDKLRRAFNYVVGYKYLAGSKFPKGSWSPSFAKEMYLNQGGNCYRYAALFCWLARGLGYDAKAVTGYVPSRSQGWAPHGWTEIKHNGTTYLYDTELTHALHRKDLFKTTYKKAPLVYRKSK